MGRLLAWGSFWSNVGGGAWLLSATSVQVPERRRARLCLGLSTAWPLLSSPCLAFVSDTVQVVCGEREAHQRGHLDESHDPKEPAAEISKGALGALKPGTTGS
jgi:hypothetical protein